MFNSLGNLLRITNSSFDDSSSNAVTESQYHEDTDTEDSDKSEPNNPWWVGLGCMLPAQDEPEPEPKKGFFGLW